MRPDTRRELEHGLRYASDRIRELDTVIARERDEAFRLNRRAADVERSAQGHLAERREQLQAYLRIKAELERTS